MSLNELFGVPFDDLPSSDNFKPLHERSLLEQARWFHFSKLAGLARPERALYTRSEERDVKSVSPFLYRLLTEDK